MDHTKLGVNSLMRGLTKKMCRRLESMRKKCVDELDDFFSTRELKLDREKTITSFNNLIETTMNECKDKIRDYEDASPVNIKESERSFFIRRFETVCEKTLESIAEKQKKIIAIMTRDYETFLAEVRNNPTPDAGQ